MILFNTRQTLKLTACEDQSPKVLVNGLQEQLRRCVVEPSGTDMLVASVAINANIVMKIGLARAAKGFYGEDVAFLHTLSGLGLDERNLFVTMDVIT